MSDLEAPPPYQDPAAQEPAQVYTQGNATVIARQISPNHVSIEFVDPGPGNCGKACQVCTGFLAVCAFIALAVISLLFIFTLFDEDNTKALVVLGISLIFNIVDAVVTFKKLEHAPTSKGVMLFFYILVQLVSFAFVCYPYSTTAMYIFVLIQYGNRIRL